MIMHFANQDRLILESSKGASKSEAPFDVY